jgi:hypothetical protein
MSNGYPNDTEVKNYELFYILFPIQWCTQHSANNLILPSYFECQMVANVIIGFVKDAKHHVPIQGFNVYHRNRLIKVSINYAFYIMNVAL